MKALGYLFALAAAGALGAGGRLACANPAVSTPTAVPKPPEPTPPQGPLTLVYGTNNRIQVTRGNHLTVIPTLTPRAAKVKYRTEGAPHWLNIHPDLGIISADARQIQGAFSSADSPQVRQDFRFRILAAGTKGAHAKQSVTANLVLTVRSVSLPPIAYPARTVSRSGDAAARTISAAPTGGLTAADADFAFDTAAPPPAWLTLSDTGTIAGEVPANADTAAYRINVTGKGRYAGAADQAEFVLTVNSLPLPGMSYTTKTVSRAGNTAARTISVPLTNGLPATQADYAFEPPSSKPAWLSIDDTGTISGTVPTTATLGSTAYTVKVTGKGIYAGETGNVTFTLNRVNPTSLPIMSYAAQTVSRAGDTAARTISVPLTNALPAAQADYAFEPPSSKSTWLSIGDTGTISGEVPTTATLGSTAYTVKITGKGIYAGITGNVTFTLNVNVNDFDTLSAAGNGCPHGIWSDGTTVWAADCEDNKIGSSEKFVGRNTVISV